MESRLRARHAILFVPLVLAIVVLGAFGALADHVAPQPKDGNPTCSSFNSSWTEFKVQPVADGVYSNGTVTVTVAVDEAAQEFDWSSNIGLDAVFAKAGSSGNLYVYDPEATSDTNLHGQLNPVNDKWYGLSHISFCYDVESSPSPSPSETETPSESPSPSVSPSETETPPGETPGTTVSPTTVTTSPSVLGTKVLGNTGADVRNLIYLALALIAMGLLAYTVARRSTKSE